MLLQKLCRYCRLCNAVCAWGRQTEPTPTIDIDRGLKHSNRRKAGLTLAVVVVCLEGCRKVKVKFEVFPNSKITHLLSILSDA